MNPESRTEFYQAHLDRVSRSFAFCIARLEQPLRDWVALSYLICRILDSIEDAPWESSVEQQQAFKEFDSWLQKLPSSDKTQQWCASFPEAIPQGERLLLQDTYQLFSDLHLVHPAPVRQVILQLAQDMSQGMQRFQSQTPRHRLQSLTEVNQYCFFVAGLVGEALTHLLELVCEDYKASPESLTDAHHFGLFLQKVNLLKDQSTDEKEGRFLVPDRHQVLQSVSENAKGAFRFIAHLPKNQKGFRLFCAWSLFLGLATLPLAQRAFLRGQQWKLPREKTLALISEVESLQTEPQELEPLFLSLASRAGLQVGGWNQLRPLRDSGNMAEVQSQPHWLLQIYRGSLKRTFLMRLGVLG